MLSYFLLYIHYLSSFFFFFSKMPKPPSAVWKYGSKVSLGIVQCKVCQKEIPSADGNTTNLDSHLWRAHQIDATGKRSKPKAGLKLKQKCIKGSAESVDANNNVTNIIIESTASKGVF